MRDNGYKNITELEADEYNSMTKHAMWSLVYGLSSFGMLIFAIVLFVNGEFLFGLLFIVFFLVLNALGGKEAKEAQEILRRE